MRMLEIWAGDDRTSKWLLIASAVAGGLYLFDGFGLGLPYPGDVALKALGIHLLAAYALRQNAPILALGLFLGSWGDIFLALQPVETTAGIVAFGLGHLVYIGLFADRLKWDGMRGMPGFLAAAGLAAFGAVMLMTLQPHFGDLRVAASLYNGIILLMAILAVIGRAPTAAIIGALLFVVSDSVLAFRLFADMLDWAGPVVWVTYYLGQAGIAVGLAQPAGGKA